MYLLTRISASPFPLSLLVYALQLLMVEPKAVTSIIFPCVAQVYPAGFTVPYSFSLPSF